MADAFQVHVEGLSEVEALLARLSKKAADLTPLMRRIGAQMESSTADNFKGGHDPNGIPWPKSRRAKETSGRTLVDHGFLRGSIVSVAGPRSAEVGTNLIYARRHNQGFTGTEYVPATRRVMSQVFGVKLAEPKTVNVKAHTRKGNTPKRQFLGLAPHDLDDIADHVRDYFGVEE